jgi:hypothetical protein
VKIEQYHEEDKWQIFIEKKTIGKLNDAEILISNISIEKKNKQHHSPLTCVGIH